MVDDSRKGGDGRDRKHAPSDSTLGLGVWDGCVSGVGVRSLAEGDSEMAMTGEWARFSGGSVIGQSAIS